MSDERAVPETTGVTTEFLGRVDLGSEIEGMEGRELRMRMVTIDPGGVYGPLHDHVDRPGLVYILRGTITDHRDGASTEYGPGLGWPEDHQDAALAREPGNRARGGDLGRHRPQGVSAAEGYP